MLLALPCYAAEVSKTVITSLVPAKLHDYVGRIACQVEVQQVYPGEHLCVRIWAPMTTDTGAGVTFQVGVCDPVCTPIQYLKAPNSNEYDIGNITKEMHHRAYNATAEYVPETYQSSVMLQARVHNYSSQPKGKWVRVDRCMIKVRQSFDECE